MPRERQSKYLWPASAVTEADMQLLFRAREASPSRIPITRLIAQAVRQTYGHVAVSETSETIQLKEAA